MNLKYIFYLFILYCKNIPSLNFKRLLFTFLFYQIIILKTKLSKNDNIIENKSLNIKKFKKTHYTIKIRDKNSLFKKINSLSSNSIIHMKNSTFLKDIEYSFNNNIDSELQENISFPYRKTICLNKFYIIETFKGDIEFPEYINTIVSIKNNFKLCSSSLILNHNDKSYGSLFLNGYIEIDLTYSIPENNHIPIISKTYNYMIRIPFYSSISIKFNSPLKGKKLYFDESNISLESNEFNTDIKLNNLKKLDDYMYLCKSITLSIVVNFSLELFDYL